MAAVAMLPLEIPDFDEPTMDGNLDSKGPPKAVDVRISSIIAAKVVANALCPSFGRDSATISKSTNGAMRLSKLNIRHPAGKVLVDVAMKQNEEAADGTSSAVIIAGALMDASSRLISKGISVSAVTASFQDASERTLQIFEENSLRVEDDRNLLIQLGSKAVKQECKVLTRVAVDSILELISQSHSRSIDIENIRMVRQLGTNIADTKLESGLVLVRGDDSNIMSNSGPAEVENANIALIDYWMKPLNSGVEVFDETSKEQMLKEERKRILDDCKELKKHGVNVVLILKSDTDDGEVDVNLQICLHFLAKMEITAIANICTDDVEAIAVSLGCHLVGHPESIAPFKLGSAEHVVVGTDKINFSGLRRPTSTILLRGPNEHVLSDAEQTIREVQSYIWTLTENPFLAACGGAAEIEAALRLKQYAQTISGVRSECVKAFADALEVIPFTLAENAGMDPVETVMVLRRMHADGMSGAGVDTKERIVTDMYKFHVVQPLLIPVTAIQLATNASSKILKMDRLDCE